MKTKLKLSINGMNRQVGIPQRDVEIRAAGVGVVVDAAHTAKEARASLDLTLRPLVADKLEFGQTLYVTISTEEEP